MKKIFNVIALVAVVSIGMTSCVDELDLKYNGPTVVEFKNYYFEIQSRLGLANFQALFPNVVPAENNTLKGISLRQPAAVQTGTITAATNSTTVTGTGTDFLTSLQVGSILKTTSGTIIGYVATIASNTSLTLSANAATAVTGAAFRASNVAAGRQVLSDSVLVQLVGPQSPSDLQVGYTVDAASTAIEGIDYDFVRNEDGKVLIKGNESSGYIYIDVYDGIGQADPDRRTLILTLTGVGEILPSENYKTFTYNIIK